MNRTEKEQVVAELRETLAGAALVVIVSQHGMTVGESTRLRRQMREAGAAFRVAKNSLASLAVRGTGLEPLAELFQGPTAIAWSEDPVAAARVIVDYADDHDGITVLGGILDDRALDVPSVVTLAKVPSLDELRGRIVGLLQAPAGRVAACTQAAGGQIARVLAARASQDEAA